MASHRALVRDMVAQVLVAGVPEVAGRVYRARTWPVQTNQVPALLVYGYDETKTRTNMDSGEAQYDVACTMAVGLRVEDISRAAETVEAGLERLAGAVCLAILTSPVLMRARRYTDPGGPVIGVTDVRTTLGVKTDGELATGEGLIAFSMMWNESYAQPVPDTDCDADHTSVAFQITPDPSVP